MSGPRILYLDIETAPHRVYAWGLWDQNIGLNQIEEPGYTLCWAAKWLGEKKVMFSSIRDGEKKMLRRIHALLEEADAVVHYYGKKFDIPTLNQEFLAHGMKPPAPFIEIDLIETVRKRFRFASNKLDYVVQRLGLGAKVQHKGMDLWRDCMAGDDAAWKVMKRYNIRDVNLLEPLYEYLKPWLVSHPNMALFTEATVRVCTTCGSKHLQRRGKARKLTQVYWRYQCVDCGSWMRERLTSLTKVKRQAILTREM